MLLTEGHLCIATTGDYGSDYGDEAYNGVPPNAIMESIQEETSPPNSTRSMQVRPSGRFEPTPLEPIKDSVSPKQSDFGSRRPSDFETGAKAGPGPAPVKPQPEAAGKSSKYDADGFLVDSDEEGEDKVQPLRPTPAAPPSEYEEVYDSSPAPSVTASPRVQDSPPEASSTFGGAFARQQQQQQQNTAETAPGRNLAKQISQLAEEESDEDDFLAAAVAAVEAQDRGQPLPAKHAQQQATAPVQTSQPASPFSRPPQPAEQPPQASQESFMSEEDDFAPQQNQTQQSRQSIPPPIPKVWQRPSAQPVVDTEDAPQRSEQSLRSRYSGNKAATVPSNDASSAAAAFFAARTGSGNIPGQARPEGANMQSMSSRPLLGGDIPPQQSPQRTPGPVPIARPPTSAYGASNATAAGAAAPRPTSQWFRSKPAVPPPAQGQPPSNGGYVNPFDSPTAAGAQQSPMALANQQKQQQRPQQEAGMFMDESDEEDQYPQGRAGQQQPQQQAGIRGAIVAGAAGKSC